MDFKDSIIELSERIEKLRGNITTEEATKNAFIMRNKKAGHFA